jgi:hypothetical protein
MRGSRRPGRPPIGDTEAVQRVLGDLTREGYDPLTRTEWRDELMRRLPCSRRTAYRALARAIAKGTLTDAGGNCAASDTD